MGEDTTLESWLNQNALFSAADGQTTSDQVRLMTIHTAKGLEFDTVFLPALDEGIFPSRQTKTRPQMEEERRLMFVALTRAKRSCISAMHRASCIRDRIACLRAFSLISGWKTPSGSRRFQKISFRPRPASSRCAPVL
ncbi:ATP-binding domain-containing protein [Allobaculum sp. Allo2]|nr:ATP-binding domain-containing protein [Allobaculum sp. Allo2]